MALNLPTNPFQSFKWLKEFNETISRIINNPHSGLGSEIYTTNSNKINGFTLSKGKLDSAGIYTNGLYWLGFYYTIPRNKQTALPWFGCQFVEEFSIDIIVLLRNLALIL